MKKYNRVDLFWLLFLPFIAIFIIVLSLTGIISGRKLIGETSSLVKRQYTLEREIQTAGHTIDDPLVFVDPYDAAPLTAIIAFETEHLEQPTVHIAGKDEATSIDFTFKLTNKHILPIYGLYAGANNKVTVSYGDAVFVGGEQTGYAVLTADPLFYSRSDLEGTLEKINKSVWFSLEKNTKTSRIERFRSIGRGCFLALCAGIACVLAAALLKVKTPAYVVSGNSDVNVATERSKTDFVNEQIKATMRYTSLQFDEKMMEEIDRHFS